MARAAAHSIIDVEAIAKKLSSQNKQVTPYRVQKQLGGGSFAWVKSALEQLGYGEDYGLPESLDPDTAELIRLVQPLVDRFHLNARSDMDLMIAKYEESRTLLDDKILKIESTLCEANDNLTTEIHRHQTTTTELEDVRAKLSESLKREQVQLTKANAQETEIRSLNEKTIAQHEMIESLRENLKSTRETAAKHLSDMKREYESKGSTAEKQIRDLKGDLHKLRSELLSLNTENAELVKERITLQENLRTKSSEFKDAEALAASAGKRNNELSDAITRLEVKLEMTSAHSESIKTERDNAMHVTQLLKQEASKKIGLIEQLIQLLPKQIQEKNDLLINKVLN